MNNAKVLLIGVLLGGVLGWTIGSGPLTPGISADRISQTHREFESFSGLLRSGINDAKDRASALATGSRESAKQAGAIASGLTGAGASVDRSIDSLGGAREEAERISGLAKEALEIVKRQGN